MHEQSIGWQLFEGEVPSPSQDTGAARWTEAFAGLLLDSNAQQVFANGRSVRLTLTEFRLLSALLSQRGAVLSRDEAIATVWGDRFRGCRRAVDVYVSRLRAKLRGQVRVETKHGVGYRIRLLPGRAAR